PILHSPSPLPTASFGPTRHHPAPPGVREPSRNAPSVPPLPERNGRRCDRRARTPPTLARRRGDAARDRLCVRPRGGHLRILVRIRDSLPRHHPPLREHPALVGANPRIPSRGRDSCRNRLRPATDSVAIPSAISG